MREIFILCLFTFTILLGQEENTSFDSLNNKINLKTDYINNIKSDSINNIKSDSLNNCFTLSHKPFVYDSIVNLKAEICEGKLFYIQNSLNQKRKKEFPDSINVTKTTSFCFFKKINNSFESLGCYTYLIDFQTDFHITSLVINYNDFLGEEKGIYAKGNTAIWDTIEKRHMNPNWEKKWERKLNVEVFNTKLEQIINQNAGIKIFGGMTKYGREKSLRLIARKEYGKKRFNTDLFGLEKKKYKQFVLRHSGNDHNNTRFKDAFLTSIISEEGMDIQQSTPTHLFINSEYWGVYNIREKINDHYIKNNYNIESEGLEILQGLKTAEFGSNKNYNELRDYIRKNNLKDSLHYKYILEHVDIRNFINYWVFQMFIVNHDARGNIRFWRSSLLDNKYRWIVYDTDLGFSNYKENTIRDFTSHTATRWFNPRWATFLIRNLLKNKQFETEFINQSFWLLSNKLTTEYLTNRIDWFEIKYDKEMKTHFTRNPNRSSKDGWYRLKGIGRNYKYWKKEVNDLKFFALKRPSYFLKHLKQKFNIETYVLNINISGEEHGKVKINQNLLEKTKLSTLFSKNHKLPIEVIPNVGYQANFDQNYIQTQEDTLNININFKKIPKKYWWRED